MKNNKIIAFAVAAMLGVSTVGSMAAFATNATTTTENQRPQKPENEVIGKITAISANSVTISLAERKMPENNGQDFNGQTPPEPPTNANGEKPANGERPNINFDDFFTLTGESTTIDISSAKFDDFSMRFKDKDETNNTSNTTTETTAAKTYKDYAVGDYIAIELTASTSKVAKSVRSANMMRGFGGPGPKGQRPDMNKSTQ